MNWLLFTDLDGTLLDHSTYKFDEALPALELLKEKKIPVIIVTSKTFAEVAELRTQLDLDYPFIIENGSAIYFPKNYLYENPEQSLQDSKHSLLTQGEYLVYPFAPAYEFWLKLSIEISEQYGHVCKSFSQMTIEEVSDLTGLTYHEAINAKDREYSDPIHWFGDDEQFNDFKARMAALGLSAVRGGRFVHLLKGTDKGIAVKWLIDFYNSIKSEPSTVMVLGDGDNDVSMLDEADYPILIRSKSHHFPKLQFAKGYKTENYGPAGWSEAVHKFVV